MEVKVAIEKSKVSKVKVKVSQSTKKKIKEKLEFASGKVLNF